MFTFQTTFTLGVGPFDDAYPRRTTKQMQRARSVLTIPSTPQTVPHTDPGLQIAPVLVEQCATPITVSRPSPIEDASLNALSTQAQQLQRMIREGRLRRDADADKEREHAADIESLHVLERVTAAITSGKAKRKGNRWILTNDAAPAIRHIDDDVLKAADAADQTISSGPWSIIISPPTSDLCRFLDLKHGSTDSSPLSERPTPSPPTLSERSPQPRKLFSSFEHAVAAVTGRRSSGLRKSHDYVADPFGSQLVEGCEEKERRMREERVGFRRSQVDAVSKLFEEARLKDETDVPRALEAIAERSLMDGFSTSDILDGWRTTAPHLRVPLPRLSTLEASGSRKANEGKRKSPKDELADLGDWKTSESGVSPIAPRSGEGDAEDVKTVDDGAEDQREIRAIALSEHGDDSDKDSDGWTDVGSHEDAAIERG